MTDALTRSGNLEDLVSRVTQVRGQLVDPLEATAILESLGYTDARVNREFGLPDTFSLGTLVFERFAGRTDPPAEAGAAGETAPRLLPLDGFSSSYIYAIPWLCLFVAARTPLANWQHPEFQSALGAALICSLVVGGGFAEMISRCGRFYLGLKQPAVAECLCGYFFRIAAAVTVALGGIAAATCWVVNRASWPIVVLAVDEFIVLGLLWVSCAVVALARAWWRIPLALAAGTVAWLASSTITGDTITTPLVAAVVILGVASVQMPSAFSLAKGEHAVDAPVPRTSIVGFRLAPYFLAGSLYFALLFVDRLLGSLGSGSVLTAMPFGRTSPQDLGQDVALLTFMIAAISIDYGHGRFVRRLPRALDEVFENGRAERHAIALYSGTVAIVFSCFVVAAVLMGLALRAAQADFMTMTWSGVAFGAYMLIGIGALNARILGSVNLPWPGVRAFLLALAVAASVAIAVGLATNTAVAIPSLLAGAVSLAVYSTIAVWTALRQDRHATAA